MRLFLSNRTTCAAPRAVLAVALAWLAGAGTAAAQTSWLDYVNYYRAMAGLPAVTEDATWSAGGQVHSVYMVMTDTAGHGEDPSSQYYTPAGNEAAQNGNVMASSNPNMTDQAAIDMWMDGPFHSVGILDTALLQSGFGSHREATATGGTPDWKMGATLDVVRGRGATPPSVTFPVVWPGNGTSVTLGAYIGNESPDPLTSCAGYTAPTGLPIVVQFAATPTVTSATVTLNGVGQESCYFTEQTYTNPTLDEKGNQAAQSTGRSVLAARHAVVIIPKSPLPTGSTYGVRLTAGGSTTAWSFTPSCSVTPSTTGITAPAAGARGTLGVTAGDMCAWLATSDSSWLRISNTSPDFVLDLTLGFVGSANVQYQTESNDSGSTRVGHLTVGDKTVTVTQAPTGTLDTVTITAGPIGVPNPVGSGQAVVLGVTAADSAGHALSYLWTTTCAAGLDSNGSFSSATSATPTWTAPVNVSGGTLACTIGVTVSDGAFGHSATGSYSQQVQTAPDTVSITSGPSGTPNPVGSGQTASLTVTASDLYGHPLTYLWSATCPAALGSHGAFSSATVQSPTWTAPANTSGITQACTISVAVTDGSLIQTAGFSQQVNSGDGLYRRYFAEGATIPPFDCRFAIANPTSTAATVTLRFQLMDGTNLSKTVTVAGMDRYTLDAKTVPGLEAAEFSTVLESDVAIVADRTMSWDAKAYAAHTETSIAAPSTVWHLAEGATHSNFNLFYTIQNPSDSDAHVTVKYLLPGGQAPIEKSYTFAKKKRSNIWVNIEKFPDDATGTALLAATDVSAKLTSDVPIIVERSMYLSTPGRFFGAGHNSAGVTEPGLAWLMSEGSTGSYFDLFVLVANPGDVDATIRATYLLPSGGAVTKDYAVPKNSRFNIWVDNEQFPEGSGTLALADTSVSTTITSTNGVPVIVERAMWWPGPTYATWAEAHNSPGATSAGTKWAVAEGEQGGPRSTQTYITIANTSSFAGQAKVTLLVEGGTPIEATIDLPKMSRTTFDPIWYVTGSASAPARFGAIIESLGATPAQIVVERPMYWNAPSADGTRTVSWSAGTVAVGTKLK